MSRTTWIHDSPERLRGPRRPRSLAFAVTVLCLAAVQAGCEATEEWVKPGASDADRDRDTMACLAESSDTVPSAQGPRRVLNQDRYRRCMSEKGYTVRKTGG